MYWHIPSLFFFIVKKGTKLKTDCLPKNTHASHYSNKTNFILVHNTKCFCFIFCPPWRTCITEYLHKITGNNKRSQNLTFYVLLETIMWLFSLLNHSEGKKGAQDDVENFSIKNNILSNPKGKLILLWRCSHTQTLK